MRDLGVLLERKESQRKIFYELKPQSDLHELIEQNAKELHNILMRKRIEGIDAYKSLLQMVATGESDVIGYGNIEDKVIPELDEIIENFRDVFATTGRIDRFIVPDSLKNIELLRDHFRKESWKKVFMGRVIERSKMYVNADIYVWDNTVGICSFEHNKFEVSIHTDTNTFKTYKSLLEVLWSVSKPIK